MKKRRAFTLIETMIVIIVIGILAGSLMLVMGSGRDKAEATRIVQDMKTLTRAALMAYASTNEWPSERQDLKSYIDAPLCNTDHVCYSPEINEVGLYITGTLGNRITSGVRKKLARYASETGLLYINNGSASLYSEQGSVSVLVKKFPSDGDPGAVFSVSFDDLGDLGLFTKLSGGKDWYIDQGTLVTPDNSAQRYGFGEPDWKDYAISVTVDLQIGNGYGIYYRADGAPDITGYIFQYDPGLGDRFVVRKVMDGREQSPFQSVRMSDVMGDGFQVKNTPHDIRVEVTGDQHAIYVDDVEVLNFQDDTFQEGGGGLRKWGSGTTVFDDVEVEML